MSQAALGWVKPELDETLRQAQAEVEYFVEDPSDTARMQLCTHYLHQVQGTLRMVELYAPAMVAEELELLAQALRDDLATDRDEACATLMRGIVLLPDYLERLQGGHRDIPIVLLPLLNDIRAARGASGISENMLFPADAPAGDAPSEAEIEHARSSISGRNQALFDTVGGAVKEELLRIKDALDLQLRTGADVAVLQPQVGELGNVADTLGMLGLGEARGVVLEQRDTLATLVSGQRAADEGVLLDIAGALLYVDATLDTQVANLGAAGVQAEGVHAADVQHTVGALAQEAINNFAAAREGFVAFIETSWNHGELAEVPRLLSEVAGALRILDLDTAADYLEGVRRYVVTELIGKRRVPGGQQLDTLADAMASLEYYLEALRDRRPNQTEILDIARSSLEALHYWPLPEEAPAAVAIVEDDSVEMLSQAEPASSFTSFDDAEPALADAPAPATATAPIEIDAALVEAVAAKDVEPAIAPAFAMDTAPVGGIPPEHGGFDARSGDIDDEIREVFLEEFDEEIANLERLLQAWRTAPEDLEKLRPIRRVFHTLKGSGRLVGAMLLGEFSWKIENMLNRVLDGTRPPTEAVAVLLGQACDTLPQFNDALHGRKPVQADWAGIETVAERLAAGEEVFHSAQVELPTATTMPEATVVEFATPVETAETTETEPSFAAPELATTPFMLDGVLREILEAEITAHLDTVRGWLAQASIAPQPASETVLRAFHTMNGAFAMADVPEITNVTAPAEQYLKRLPSSEPVPPAGVTALADSVRAIADTIAGLGAPWPHVPVFTELPSRLSALRDGLPPSVATVVDSFATATADIQPPTPLADTEVIDLVSNDLSTYFDAPTNDIAGDAAQESTPAAETFVSLEEEAPALDALTPMDEESASMVEEIVLETESTAEPQAVELLPTEEQAVEEQFVEEPAAEASVEPHAEESTSVTEMTPPATTVVAAPVLLWLDTSATPTVLATPDAAVSEVADTAPVDTIEAEAAFTGQEFAEPTFDDAVTVEVEAVESVAEPTEAEPSIESQPVEDESWQSAETSADETQAQVEAEIATEDNAREIEVQAVEAEEVEASAETQAPAEGMATSDTSWIPAAETAHEPQPELETQPRFEAPVEYIEAALPVEIVDLGVLDAAGLDLELVDIFVEEGRDLLDHSDEVLASLRVAPTEDAHALIVDLQRDLHTLKGGARMAGINSIGDLGHAVESLLEEAAAQRIELGIDDIRALERGFDALHALLAKTGEHRAVGIPKDLIAEFNARALGAPLPSALAQDPTVPKELAPLSAPLEIEEVMTGSESMTSDPQPVAALPQLAALTEPEAFMPASQEQVRIRADLLDRLVNFAGEVAIYRSRLEQQLGAFRGAMAELDRTNTRLHDQLRRLDLETEAQIVARYQREHDVGDPAFDPLELDRFSTLQQLSRALAESAADIGGLQSTLDDLSRNQDLLLQQQSRVSGELQDGLMRARMVPFDGLVPRLRRVLRQAAADTGKLVRLELDGAHGELDRSVLERMTAPLEHLLRNAMAHGLETPDARSRAGKPAEGVVQIRLRREGSEMVLQIADDGAGLDHAVIRRRAVERGMIAADAQLSDAELERLILESGFSTAESVSQLAGRGVGMDVVHNEVRQLGGVLEIASQAGKGTTFTLRLPQTLAVTQAVFVQIGDTQFAVPVAAVSGIGRIARERYDAGSGAYAYGGEDYALYDLGALTGHAPAKAEGQTQLPLLLVRAGDLRAAIAVDEVLGNREIVVKPVGPQIASMPGIYGATVTGDGSIVVILDAAPLVRRFVSQPQAVLHAAAQMPEQRHVPLVMVVDDSLTMRKVTGRVLERHNFEVAVARDGVEALEKLEERIPDLMLLDIEMPRMDGYELATAMRADARFRNVPIVMITSRTGDKHRQRAFEIGVQRYLGKPYQELDLMRNVYDLLGIARARD
ncbi:MAG: Hpt domain-containing protein [Pseudoxanthomonas sp.]